ncbi:MAG: lysine transporter LysE [Cenarchaeum symbiont of Oopsacas minuta]|nr:lysine transporter LysE [Cenarchaeum symbiont of Oopsacas minuta]
MLFNLDDYMYEEFFALAFTIIIISITGVMSPGPLFTANIAYGIKGGIKSGLKMAIGHTIIEMPIVAILGLGIITIDGAPWFIASVAAVGAAGLFVFAVMQTKAVLHEKRSDHIFGKDPLVVGIMLSAMNPFFILWWLTIGLKLITDVIHQWGLIGIPLMFMLHIWFDYVWMMFVGGISGRASKFISNKLYRIIMLGTSIVLVYFGIVFAIDAIMYFIS